MKYPDPFYIGVDRVLKRGTGTILEKDGESFLLEDSVSEAEILVCTDAEISLKWLAKHPCNLLSVLGTEEVAEVIVRECGYDMVSKMLQCVYPYKTAPVVQSDLKIRTAVEKDLPEIMSRYDLITEEEMRKVIRCGNLLIGEKEGVLVGFAGEHLEGSMGILNISPEYRRLGYGSALEATVIAKTLQNGFTPFGQVSPNNEASLALQKKMGMQFSNDYIYWMWK